MGISSFRDIKQDVAPNAARHRQPFVHRDTGGQMMPAKPRVFSSWMFALVLLSAAALAAISISSALFGIPPGSNFLGELLADSYGAIAFAIPVYLLFAAYILADKSFKPARIFVLNCVIFPFITLAIGFSYLREFEEFEQKIPLLQFLGKNGFGFLMIFLTVMECIVIAAFTAWLFPPVVARKPLNGPDIRPRPQPNTEARIVPIPIQTENTPVKPLSEPALPENPRDSLFYEVKKSDPLTPQGKAALEDAYEKAQAELEKMNIKKLDVALENLNEKLSFVDELDTNRELREKKNDVPVLKLAVQEDEEIFTEFDDDTLEEIDSFGEEELECGTTSAEHDIEKLISRAENEAAQKTNEFIRKKDGATGAPAAAVPANTSYDKPRQNIMAEKKKSPRIERYAVPVDGILSDYEDDQYWLIDDATKKAALVLKETLNEFNIHAEVTGIRKGPVITMFEILPSPGVKLSKIVNLQDNIALRLAASPVRIVAPIPGKHAVGIEVPNKRRSIVSFKDLISTQINKGDSERKKWALPVVLGKDITGGEVTVDLAAMPHLLIAGATGSGKSVCVNTMILSLLYQCHPQDCRLILIDPKIVELKLYNDIPHLLTPVITEPKRAFQALQYCICEMERRYACLDSMGVRDIKTYNKRIRERNIAAVHMPYIVVVIDEFADLMATTGKELESTVARLAAMSRAVGIHIVLATQRPSIDVITGLIKSNIPSRIAFMVASMMDSRIIIDTPGAEKLLGKGDMLYSGITDPFPVRMQGAFVSEEEVERVVAHVKSLGEPDYIDEEIFIDDDDDAAEVVYEDGDDPLYDKALEVVIQQGKASASYIQRRLKVGYNRAARIVEEMEHRGVVGPAQGSRPRELLRAV